jgi:outer membrane protein assembly factor BamA
MKNTILVALLLAALHAPVAAAAGRDSASGAALARAFRLESIVVTGNDRTPPDVVRRALGLQEGDDVDPDRILSAVAALRDADLFADVEFRTERGSERGSIRLALDVREKGVEFRFGTGYRDLDGWYVMPAQLRFDNRLGRGERTRLSAKLGYHIAGVEATFDEEYVGPGGAMFWGASAGAFGLQRRYFLDGVEVEHPVGRGHVGARLGRRLGAGWAAEIGARFERVDVDSTAAYSEDDDVRGIGKGDEIPFASLPEPVASAVGDRAGQILHAALSIDRRSERLVASTPAGGVWGSLRGEAILRGDTEALAVTLDLRGYRATFGGVFVARARAGAIGEQAAFYDRFHLGGLYTVRGFPSQSLSGAGGDTRFWSTSLEFRGPLAGRPDRPLVAGVLFADAGAGWSGASLTADDVSASAGFGFRVRVPVFDSLGFDFGVPIGPTPVGESFHAHGALGWNF